MGQRTLTVVELKQKIKDQVVVKRRSYHHQWGYGYNLANIALLIVVWAENCDTYGVKSEDYFNELLDKIPELCPRLSKVHTDEELNRWVGADGKVNMSMAIDHHDNNNGGVRVCVEFDEYMQVVKSEVEFNTGLEDSDYVHPVTVREYLQLFHTKEEVDEAIKERYSPLENIDSQKK